MKAKKINIAGNKLIVNGEPIENLPVCSYEIKDNDVEKEIAELTITVQLIDTDVKVETLLSQLYRKVFLEEH